MVDAFLGKFEVESRENFDEFMKGVGVPEEFIEKARSAKVVSEFKKDGDVITSIRIRPMKTSTNSFKLGEESEIENIMGDKMKVTVNLVDGKLVTKGEKYEAIMEMVGGKLKETVTVKGHTMSRVSVKQ